MRPKRKKNIITPSADSFTLLRIEASSNSRSVRLVTQQLRINDGVAQTNHPVVVAGMSPWCNNGFWALELEGACRFEGGRAHHHHRLTGEKMPQGTWTGPGHCSDLPKDSKGPGISSLEKQQ